jgi:hypothetical protein
MQNTNEQSGVSDQQIESKVKLADLTDTKTAEDLRHYLNDLMFRQGWGFNDLFEAINKHSAFHNEKQVHPKIIKSALSGKKQFRNTAYKIESFLKTNKGPLFSQTNIPN